MNTKLQKKDHFHFIGIGGIGMSAIAIALIKKGYSVSGSDLVKNKETQRLKELGAIVFESQVKNNIDLVISKYHSQKIKTNYFVKIKHQNNYLEVIVILVKVDN